MTDTQVTWLTQEAYDRLKAELDQLIANRPVIAAEINDRREEGDLRENGGYHAAREEQGQQEARIRQLQELLNNAKVGEAPKQSGVALPGSVVKVYYDDDKSDTETFLIATRQEGVDRRQARGVLAELAAGRRADRRQGRRDPHLHRAQRQHRQGHAGQRGALPLLEPTAQPATVRPWRRSPRTCSCCCWTTPPRSPVSTDPPRAGALRPRCCWIWRYACRIRPSMAGESVAAGPAGGAAGPAPMDPVVAPAFELLQRRPLRPATAVKRLSRHTEDEPRQLSGVHGPDPACSAERRKRFSHPYAWPLTNRERVGHARSALLSALFDAQTARPADGGDHLAVARGRRARCAAEPQRPRLAVGATPGRRNRQRQLGGRVSDGDARGEPGGHRVRGARRR